MGLNPTDNPISSTSIISYKVVGLNSTNEPLSILLTQSYFFSGGDKAIMSIRISQLYLTILVIVSGLVLELYLVLDFFLCR